MFDSRKPHHQPPNDLSAEGLAILLPVPQQESGEGTPESFLRQRRYVASLLSCLCERGIEVTVFSEADIQPDSISCLKFVTARAKCIRLPLSSRFERTLTLRSPSAVRAIASQRSRTVLAFEYNMGTLWALVASRLSRKRVWIFQESARSLSSGRRLFRRVLAGQADLIIAGSEAAKFSVCDQLKQPASKVRVVALVTAPDRSVLQETRPVMPERGRSFIFLTVGRLITLKNVDTLIRAFADVHAHLPDTSLWIVGDGSERRNLENLTLELALAESVVFLGSVPYSSIGHYYDACDVFVFPSHNDYRSVSVLEALRFGKPVICSSQDGNAGEMVIHGVNGFIFAPTDLKSLIRHMLVVAKGPELRQHMSRASEELILGQTYAEAASRLAELLAPSLANVPIPPTDELSVRSNAH